MPISVNGELIDEQAVRAEASLVKEKLREEMPEKDELALELQAREWARENVIERVLLFQAVRRDLTPGDPAEPEVLVERLLAKVTAGVRRPTSKEVSELYRRARRDFEEAEKVRASHIVKNIDEGTLEADAQREIEAIQEMLARGEDFVEVADRHSDCPGRGGDLGFFARGQMVSQFDDVVFALKTGETSGVFRTPFGYHIAKLIDRRPPRTRPLQEFRQELEEHLWSSWKQQAVEAFLDSLRAAADVRRTTMEKAV